MMEKSETSPLDSSLHSPDGAYQAHGLNKAASLASWTGLRLKLPLMVGAILILWAVFWFRLQNLMVSDWNYDQGFYLLVAHLMAKGFAPYRDIHMSEPPGMVWSAYFPLVLFGSIWGARFAMACFTMVAIAAAIRIGQRLAGMVAGFLVGGVLLFKNEFFGTAVDPGLPSVTLALVALAFALNYRATKRSAWLWLSALALAGSLLIKIYMIAIIPLI